ncbi:MAG: choice-of-anchor L domain-containing protein [Chthoniobacteraceae bacterium]
MEFYANNTKVGTILDDTRDSFTWLQHSAGNYQVKAIAYFADGTTSTSSTRNITVVANTNPSVSISLDSSGGAYTAPMSPKEVNIQAQATDPDSGDYVERVQFYYDGRYVGEVYYSQINATNGNNLFSIPIAEAIWGGSHQVSAIASDSRGGRTTVGMTFSVSGNHAPSVAITSPSNAQEITATGDVTNVVVTGTCSDVDVGDSVSSVMVNIYNADQSINKGVPSYQYATVTGNTFQASISLPPGTYSLTAAASDTSSAIGYSLPVKCLVVAPGTYAPSTLLTNICGEGMATQNLSFIGDLTAATLYSGGRSLGLESEAGILLSTGYVDLWSDNNNNDSGSLVLNEPGDSDLDLIAVYNQDAQYTDNPLTTHDATGLEFDVVPTNGQLEVAIQFASEEYDEYAPGGTEGSPFNDLFAIYVDGVNITSVPGSRDLPGSKASKIGVDTINSTALDAGGNQVGSNRQLYCDNPVGYPSLFHTGWDGFTFNIKAVAAVSPNQTHHVKIVVADTSDYLYDSGLFIRKASFRSVKP